MTNLQAVLPHQRFRRGFDQASRRFLSVVRLVSLALPLLHAGTAAASPASPEKLPSIPGSEIGARTVADGEGADLARIFYTLWPERRLAAGLTRSEHSKPVTDRRSTLSPIPSECEIWGLAVSPTAFGARLRCRLQRLEGEATTAGLWLNSTGPNAVNDRCRVVATAVGRAATTPEVLPPTGTISVAGRTVQFIRPGLVEEYSVSSEGVRQDFLIGQKPAGSGELRVTLAVDGAEVKPRPGGAQLLMDHSGRKTAYHRLRVHDATGRQLPARMEVMPVTGEVRSHRPPEWRNAELPLGPSRPGQRAKQELGAPAFYRSSAVLGMTEAGAEAGLGQHALREAHAPMLAVLVDDTAAVYPVRIDPTFSDANWSGLGDFGVANGTVAAAAVDGAGNLYIGGEFTAVGAVAATNIAKWNGSNWSALGAGLGCDEPGTCVSALAVSGSDVYAGGSFTTAGGSAANHVARWNGSSWTALDSGMDGHVAALAVLGNDLYAGGAFTTAGGLPADAIARWNGTNWSALVTGVNGDVRALAVAGTALYVGGGFSAAGGVPANSIARWDESGWSALGSGLNGYAHALAVAGSAVFAAGGFTAAGGSPASYVARWDGTNWTALGAGMNFWVYALAAADSEVYAGGLFSTAGDGEASKIARWDGSSWSALGSGIAGGTGGLFGPFVSALAVTDTELLAGGDFTLAGGKPFSFIARAYRLPLPPLALLRSGPELTISWPAAGTAGFTLEQAVTPVAPATWEVISTAVTDDGTNKSVTVPAVNSTQFFRLRRP